MNPGALAARGSGSTKSRAIVTPRRPADRHAAGAAQAYQIGANGQLLSAARTRQVIVTYQTAPGAVRRCRPGRRRIGLAVSGEWVDNRSRRDDRYLASARRNTGSSWTASKPLCHAANRHPALRQVSIVSDRSIVDRASFADVKLTLVCRDRAGRHRDFHLPAQLLGHVIPSVTVPLSLVGTFGIMYMLGYSLDNLSLMALTLAVGLVVDDAIVMLENIFRYLEQGCDRVTAALKGAKEIGFTIVSITVSLVAVFIPILFMSGIVGRLFREFGVVVAVAIVLSALIALTLSPMMASLILKNPRRSQTRSPLPMERAQLQASHRRLRTRAQAHATAPARHHDANLLLIVVSGWMFYSMPKGFFPQEDTGLIFGFTQADQDISFDGMASRVAAVAQVVAQDPPSPTSVPRSAAPGARA